MSPMIAQILAEMGSDPELIERLEIVAVMLEAHQ